MRSWLEIVCDHTSNYKHDTKNNSELQVSRFYRGEKITMKAGCRIIRGSYIIRVFTVGYLIDYLIDYLMFDVIITSFEILNCYILGL